MCFRKVTINSRAGTVAAQATITPTSYQGVLKMKTTFAAKIAVITILTLLASSTVFAAGGKNRSTVGKGKTVTGTTAKGSAPQVRAGR